jgi:hypothetical protein
MALFSQRSGIRPLSKAIQRERIDDDLRNALWSSFHETFVIAYSYEEGHRLAPYYPLRDELNNWRYVLWTQFYRNPSDTKPSFKELVAQLRTEFFGAEWHWIFDLLEFSAKHAEKCGPLLIRHANAQLEREHSAYRFVGSEIVEITDRTEIASIEEAVSGPKMVKNHLERAIELLSDRRTPDFRNSIKESISAVEAICRLISNNQNDTLGAAVKKVAKKNPLHPAFEQALLKLYGFTSDEGGIRHALMEEPSLEYADARFMLVLCSAFINFLLTRAAKSGTPIK